jgi:aminopeptidase N
VTAHETGHQWWGSRVSNANQRNYWFVETLAEYFSALYLERVHGRKEYDQQVEEWRRNVVDRDMWVSVQNASTHLGGEIPGAAYQSAVYNKGPYMFHCLRETFGDEKFFPYLKKFSQELTAKREIVSRDIQMASEKDLGGIGPDGNPYKVDLEWFFDQWLRSAGIPQYRLDYDVRRAESGDWIIEGVVHQRVVVGSSRDMAVMEGQAYRGVVDITALGKKGQEYKSRVLIDGAETPFRLSVPDKPLEVALNEDGGMLSHDVKVNVPW